MPLPNCEKVYIADAKLYKYLFNANHPERKGKAQFYERIGYTATNGETLRDNLLHLVCLGTVTGALPDRIGHKYTVISSINARNGKAYELLTVWAIEPPENEPRLITAYPNDERLLFRNLI